MVSTQLRVSQGAVVGIDYNALNFIFDLYKLDYYEKYITFRIIKIMEEVFIRYFNNKMEKEFKTKLNNRNG